MLGGAGPTGSPGRGWGRYHGLGLHRGADPGAGARGPAGSLRLPVVSELLCHRPGGCGWEGEPQPPPSRTLGWGTVSEELSGAVTGESRRCH